MDSKKEYFEEKQKYHQSAEKEYKDAYNHSKNPVHLEVAEYHQKMKDDTDE